MIGYSIFIVAMSIAIICISYDGMADARGWPVGAILAKDASFPKILAFVTGLWILGKSFIFYNWWTPIVIVVIGWFLAFILTILMKKYVQFLCIQGVVPAFILTVLYKSEQEPFGFLQQFFL